jgi:uncharacterized protein (TIGR02246 family)
VNDEDAAAAVARSLLDRLQAAISARDLEPLVDVYDDDALLVGTSAAAQGRAEVRAYLEAIVTAPESLRWEWADVVVSHHAPGTVAFAGLGAIVVTSPDGERRAPFRLTALAVESPSGWRLRQFHGSIPSDF